MQKTATLRQLHQGPRILVLPNAWDVASARIFEKAGFPAIATSSAGVAFSLGFPDGQRISGAEMIAAVKRIASSRYCRRRVRLWRSCRHRPGAGGCRGSRNESGGCDRR